MVNRITTYATVALPNITMPHIFVSFFMTKITVETINADNDVIEGIRKVNTLLTRRRIHFYCGLVHTLKEMQSYCWDDKALQQSGKEKPIKVADHAPDAVRYYVSTVIRPRRIANV